MDDYALVLNAGSSSLKFCVFQRPDDKDWQVAARGQIEGIGTSPRLSAKDAQGAVLVNNSLDAGVADGHAAIDALASWLRSKWHGARVLGVGHRVVHGGVRYGQPVLLTRQILSDLYELVPLAPLHQPYNLAAIDAVFERLPDVPQVACFDTGFHSGHSQVAELIPLPRSICKSGLQRYGFHGLSYAAIHYAKVKVIRDESGLVIDYESEGGFPVFGNNDNRVDQIASWVMSTFMGKLRKYPTDRNAVHTQSILSITSNVVYGKSTGNTPDGRRRGEPFAPGANPMHGRDKHGIHASAASVAKIPYRDAADGISLTATLLPEGLGRVREDRATNLRSMLDAFFSSTGYHMNVYES